MKKYSIVLIILTIVSVLAFAAGGSFDIERIYSERRISTGTYEVTVSRIDSNAYEVKYTATPFQRGDIIKTKYCYEYVYFEDVIVKVTATSGSTIGKIYF
jgi:hypothetical protein